MEYNAVMLPIKISRRLARLNQWDETVYDYPDRGYDIIPEKPKKSKPPELKIVPFTRPEAPWPTA